MKCRVCGSETRSEYDNQTKVDYYFCDCGFIFKDRIMDGEVEFEHYSKHNNTMENEGYVNMFEKFLSKVDEYLVGPNMLDFGCGPGPVLAELLKRRGYKVKTYDKYFNHDADYDMFLYNTIVSTEAIEHFDDPIKELKKMRELLVPKGRLIIQTMFIQQPFMEWWYRRDYTHISFFDVNVFELIGRMLGFNILYTDNSSIIVLEKI